MLEIKLALRALVRKPGFSLAVVAMFALGIAANTAIFSIFNGLFLSSPPFPEPRRLVYMDETAPRWNLKLVGIAYPDFHEWRAQNQSFESMSVFSGDSYNLSGFGDSIRLRCAK